MENIQISPGHVINHSGTEVGADAPIFGWQITKKKITKPAKVGLWKKLPYSAAASHRPVTEKVHCLHHTYSEGSIMCDDVDAGRECIIKGVGVYMGEDPDNLLQEYVSLDQNTINKAIEDTTVGIYVVKEHASSDEAEDIGIVLEGLKVLQNLDNVALGVAVVFGLMYALNLSYPADLRYTFEVIQKIWMELDGGKLSNRALALKNRLHQ